MAHEWDTIIIGGGIGGLSAAAHLVRSGQRVIVVEKSPHPGGTAYVYIRKGFHFPMGPLGFSSPDLVCNTLEKLGQPFHLPFRRVHYEVHAFGKTVLLSQPFAVLSKNLSTLFPEDTKGIKRFFRDLDQTLTAMGAPRETKNRALLEKIKCIAAKQYLETHISDWRLRRFLGSIGTHEPYSSIPLMAAMWNLMSRKGIWYPPGGMRSLCNQLVKAATAGPKKGTGTGEIRLGVAVKNIKSRNGRVNGVVLGDGSTLEAKHIISNADFKTTFLTLMAQEDVPDFWKKAVMKAKQTGSVMQVCLGIDNSKVDLSAFARASRLLYRKQSDRPDRSPPDTNTVDWTAQQIEHCALAFQELEFALLTKEDPSLAPPGHSVLVIRTEADHHHFSSFRSTKGGRKPLYKDYKMHLGRTLMKEAATVIPGLMESVVVIDVATPLTFEDQGGRSEGAVAGWSWNYEDTADYMPLVLTSTPIGGLFMAGYQAYTALFMGGVPTAMESGRQAASAVLQDVPPTQAVDIPTPRL